MTLKGRENVAVQKISDHDFIAIWGEHAGSVEEVAEAMGMTVRAMLKRRRTVEDRQGIQLQSGRLLRAQIKANRAVVELNIDDGRVMIFSDAHFWPGEKSAAFDAFVRLAKKLRPEVIICNGDAFDGAKVSRYPSIGWESKPKVQDELKACQEALGEIYSASKGARHYWCLGNHDARYETRLAAVAPEYERVEGFHLKDKFPEWIPCWRVDINTTGFYTIVRHREAGGEHADWNNIIRSGARCIVTGHDHRIGVTPMVNYRGVNYGVRTGFLADSADDPQFLNYLEAKAPNWLSGFAVLTYKKGRLLYPEVAVKTGDGVVEFRGEQI
jgi:predicted phosphodiesterase